MTAMHLRLLLLPALLLGCGSAPQQPAAAEPQQEPYGLTADCTDDQGTRFYLGQFPAG